MIALFPIEVKVREFIPKLYLAYELIKNHNFQIIISKSRLLTSQLPYLTNAIYLDKSISEEKKYILDKVKKKNFYTALDEEAPMILWPKFYFETRLNNSVLKACDRYFVRGRDESQIIKKLKKKNFSHVKIMGHPKYDLLKPKVRHIFDRDVNRIKNRYKKFVLVVSSFNDDTKGSRPKIMNELKDKYSTVLKKSKSFREFLELQNRESKSYKELLNITREMAKNFPHLNFIFRPHPVQDKKKVEKRFDKSLKNIFVEDDLSVIPWIIACDFFVHSHCSTSYDAAILNKKIITYKKYKPGPEIPFCPGYKFDDGKKLINFLKKLNQSKIKYNYFKNKLPENFIANFANSKNSSKFISKEFLDLLKNKNSLFLKEQKSIYQNMLIEFVSLLKNLIHKFYIYFGIKSQKTLKFTNINKEEILDQMNLFQSKIMKNKRINFKVERLDYQVFLIKKSNS